ncbi:D-lactate dehydrogenase [Pediococcus damnosus]|uniref:D-lactate dehydrogenase n=1 Tax=Pediococcus damnosus TaxID=51663 RepID=A0A0R2HG64_9LACO|nr:D-2-hydroxyacid dehydrogenase [Pediococcus damnosus]AMV61630.1 D-lactate dehydrogenase [Pediococcus damnosus]AMV62008.1 D-lactate dehydrogenase [Pediococcus damnosus]AMV65992.1 D-lactate dehydrogenase [Pediococcus damnosus]AMV68141.1 D-lactate dehydrogenase [Pediococcus damnosus]KJU74587.1 lactate dehydrogenase [Pediococcus damnosus LMG 28219]
MKIIDYGIRDDEKPYLDEWVKKNNVEVKAVSDLLTEDNIDLAKGYDGVIAYQQKPYTDGIFKKMDEFGIHAFSLRNVGVDNVPAESVKKYNIKVSNVPAYSPSAIAELSVTALMALLRRLPRFENKMAKGDFRWAPDIAQELNELTVGVVGTGRIGRAAMDIFKGFGAKVIGYDVFRNPELEKEGIYVDSLDDIYAQADVITLHVPALKDNYHMLNDDAFSKMKDGVYILNYARGSLIDTDALIRALDNGKVAGAGLDTYENEVGIFDVDHKGKKIDDDVFNNLYARDNVLITPHAAFYTTKAVKNMVQISLNNNKSFIENGKADNEVSFD